MMPGKGTVLQGTSEKCNRDPVVPDVILGKILPDPKLETVLSTGL